MMTLPNENEYITVKIKKRAFTNIIPRKYKEIVLYIFFGGCTTLVNIAIYYFLTRGFHIPIIASTIAAWITSVLFAYLTNRRYVFQSKNSNVKATILELGSFVLCRLLSGALDIGNMYFFVKLLGINDFIIKIISNIVIVMANYIASRSFVFKQHNADTIEKNADKSEVNPVSVQNKLRFFYRNMYVIYTVTFFFLLPVVFLSFLLEGKSFVWYMDGLNQHLAMLMYYGELLRDFLAGHGFPMVDYKIGLGYDTISTLSYYVLGDPFALLSIFMTKENSVIMYNLLILLRFYLAGVSFIMMMKYWKKDGMGAVLGALIYIFSGFTLFSCLRHPYFMNPLIYLPLMLVGIELVLRRKKPYLMIAMVFISAVSNFYFFFMLTIIMIVYIIFRYFTHYIKEDKNRFTGFILTGLRTGACYLLGVGMSAFLLLPIITAFLNNGRLCTGPKLLRGYFHYNKAYYIKFVQSFIASGGNTGYSTYLSYSFLVVVSLAILFCNKQYRKLQVAYLLIILGLFVPAFGYFMNGFSYVTNRWSFVLGLLVAVTFCITYEKIFQLKKAERWLLMIGLSGYGITVFVFPTKQTVKEEFYYILAAVVLILMMQMKFMRSRKILCRMLLYCMVPVSIVLNAHMLYSTDTGNYVSQFLSEKAVDKKLYHGVMKQITKIKDDDFYRIDTYGDKALNEALNVGYNDVSGYYSLTDGSITKYLSGLENLSQISAYRYDNLDHRTILDTLACVKYFVTTNKNAVPYGYTLLHEVVGKKKVYYLYENEYALPLGYTYENYMLSDDYNQLDALEKQNAMLNSVVLNENTACADKTQQATDYGITKLNPIITEDENIKLSDNRLRILKNNAQITLGYQTGSDAEIYIRLENLKIKKAESISYNFYARPDYGVTKKINVRSSYYNTYFGKDDYLMNTGNSMAGYHQVVMTFPKKLSFRYDSIGVYSVDMNYYKSKVEALKQNSLMNIKQSVNRLQGDIELDRCKILVLSIPYSKGWTAYVDGERTEIHKGNVMYMALPLEAGSHHIVLIYRTPFLKLGGMISAVALTILIGTMIYLNIKQRKSAFI